MYTLYSDLGIEGQIADASTRNVDSYAAEGVVPFGRGVVQGTADNQCKLPESTQDEFLGASVFSHTEETARYEDHGSVPVMTFGRIIVDVDGVFAKNEEAYVLVTGDDTNGQFTADDTGTIGPVGKFMTTGQDALGIVQLQVGLRGPIGPEGPEGTP